MDELKQIIASNIQHLRTDAGMTQTELAEKLNYSDKAVSKWERAESLPDITVCKEIADIFNVKIDYLVKKEHTPQSPEMPVQQEKKINKRLMVSIGIVIIWLVASLVFVVVDSVVKNISIHWLSFAYAVPLSVVLWLIFDAIWFKKKNLFILLSVLVWTLLAVTYLTLLIPLGMNIWVMFIIGVPAQVIIILASKIKYRSKDKKQ